MTTATRHVRMEWDLLQYQALPGKQNEKQLNSDYLESRHTLSSAGLSADCSVTVLKMSTNFMHIACLEVTPTFVQDMMLLPSYVLYAIPFSCVQVRCRFVSALQGLAKSGLVLSFPGVLCKSRSKR